MHTLEGTFSSGVGTCSDGTCVSPNGAHEQDDAFAFLTKVGQQGPGEVDGSEQVGLKSLQQSGGAEWERALVNWTL